MLLAGLARAGSVVVAVRRMHVMMLDLGARGLPHLTHADVEMQRLVGQLVVGVDLDVVDQHLGDDDVAGLVAAIRAETTKLQERTGMACSFESTLDFFEGPQEASVALFRIFEECLTNVSRHAKASRVDVRLRREPGSVSLEVKDNGKGFDPKAASADGSLVLIGMRERAYSLGGKLSIRSGARKGTAVRVTRSRSSMSAR